MASLGICGVSCSCAERSSRGSVVSLTALLGSSSIVRGFAGGVGQQCVILANPVQKLQCYHHSFAEVSVGSVLSWTGALGPPHCQHRPWR